jgi:hypothetical protein
MKRPIAFVLFLLASIPAQAGTLRGTVVDLAGGAIRAQVIVHWDSAGLDGVTENVGLRNDATATADETGHFSFDLPPGVYDVFVSSPGFFPYCEKISVKRDEVRAFQVRLKVSRMLVVKVD